MAEIAISCSPLINCGIRKEWGRFYQITDEIDPHLYEVAHVIDGS
jgi:hypothetical protein